MARDMPRACPNTYGQACQNLEMTRCAVHLVLQVL